MSEFEMKCPKCRSNRWKLTYTGDSDSIEKLCDKTEHIDTYIGIYGDIKIVCKCGFIHHIHVGSD